MVLSDIYDDVGGSVFPKRLVRGPCKSLILLSKVISFPIGLSPRIMQDLGSV